LPTAVRIGEMDKPGLLHALRSAKVQMNRAAEALFEDPRFTASNRPAVVEIAALSVAGLGFGEGATHPQIVARALAAGLTECPLELGPHLRLQFRDQPEVADATPPARGMAPPGAITVASAPLDDRYETPKGFYLRHVGGVLWLRGYWSSPDDAYNPHDVFVFARAR
jgi:hypothetical protein